MMKASCLAVLAAAGLFAVLPTPTAHAARLGFSARFEKIDNPSYQNWAKFKPGTTVKMKVLSEMAGQKNEMTTIQKLVEVSADKVVVESSGKAKYGDMEMDIPATKMDIPAKVDKLPEQEKGKNEVKPKTGEEEIEVAGKKYKAKWTETVMEQQGTKTTSKVWISEEFPGMTLKMETKIEGAMAGTTSSEVIEVKLGA